MLQDQRPPAPPGGITQNSPAVGPGEGGFLEQRAATFHLFRPEESPQDPLVALHLTYNEVKILKMACKALCDSCCFPTA